MCNDVCYMLPMTRLLDYRFDLSARFDTLVVVPPQVNSGLPFVAGTSTAIAVVAKLLLDADSNSYPSLRRGLRCGVPDVEARYFRYLHDFSVGTEDSRQSFKKLIKALKRFRAYRESTKLDVPTGILCGSALADISLPHNGPHWNGFHLYFQSRVKKVESVSDGGRHLIAQAIRNFVNENDRPDDVDVVTLHVYFEEQMEAQGEVLFILIRCGDRKYDNEGVSTTHNWVRSCIIWVGAYPPIVERSVRSDESNFEASQQKKGPSHVSHFRFGLDRNHGGPFLRRPSCRNRACALSYNTSPSCFSQLGGRRNLRQDSKRQRRAVPGAGHWQVGNQLSHVA